MSVKTILLTWLLICLSLITLVQPDIIKRIMAKQKAGEELTEEEEATFEKWIDDMTSGKNMSTGNFGIKPGAKPECPPP